MNIDLTSQADMDYRPTLHRVHCMLDIWIVGEHEARLATFTNWLLAHQNVNLTGQRSSGKTWMVDNIGRFLPDKNGLYNIAKGSDKSGWYQAEALKRHSHVMIAELNKIPKDMEEVIKDWGEGKDSAYKSVVFEGGSRRIEEFHLPRKPFIFCLADEEEIKLNDQLRSRLTVIRSDCSEDQNLAVNKQQAELALCPVNPRPVNPEEFEKMKYHISTLPPWDEEGYRHPAAPLFVGCIPSVFTDCRRDFPKYLKNCYGITRFHWKDRMSMEAEVLTKENRKIKKKIFFVTPQDMYYNHVIYGNTLIESSLRCSNMERQMISIIQQAGEVLDRERIQQRMRQNGVNISNQMLAKHLQILSDLGYIETIISSSRKMAYSVGRLFDDFMFEVDWKSVISETITNIRKYYPDIADDYIQRYCESPTVIHPYTGDEICLNDIQVEKQTLGKPVMDEFGLGRFDGGEEKIE